MKKAVLLCAFVVALAIAVTTSAGFAFQIEPEGTKSAKVVISHEKLLQRLEDKATPRITSLMSAPVHARIAHHIYGCEGDDHVCSKPTGTVPSAPLAVVAGTEWNDNPPFKLAKAGIVACEEAIKKGDAIQLPKQSMCWILLMNDGEKKSAANTFFDRASGAALVLRVHYGDLQFLHAMASKDNEDPNLTRQRILMWAEFTWKVATGAFILGTRITETNVEGMKDLFSGLGWSVQDLFTLGDTTYRKQIKDLAFGSLLHMISDSFALSHTDRAETHGDTCKGMPEFLEPGRIVQFHAYGGQDHKLHAAADTQKALDLHFATVSPSAVDVGKDLLALYRQGKKWDELRPYMECVFTLDETATLSGPGERFKPEPPAESQNSQPPSIEDLEPAN